MSFINSNASVYAFPVHFLGKWKLPQKLSPCLQFKKASLYFIIQSSKSTVLPGEGP